VERFTEADLIEALLEAQPSPDGVPGSMTTAELCDALGRSKEYVRKQLAELKAAGKLGLSEKQITRLDGKPTTVAAYYLKK
jgi:hypothetical protein